MAWQLPLLIWRLQCDFLGFNDPKTKLIYTVWKFQNFSVIQNLREINFGESRSSKTAVFGIFGPLSFVHLVKVQEFIQNQNSEPQNMLK